MKIHTDVSVETGRKTQMIISRTLALWELQRQGKLETMQITKKELAEIFGVSRPALDRSLAAVTEAQGEVDRLLRRLDPTYLQRQAEHAKRARQLYAQRDTPGVFLDEDQYQAELKAAGLDA